MSITFNPAINDALDLMENSSQNLFITGRAGTGKSTFLWALEKNLLKEKIYFSNTIDSKSNSFDFIKSDVYNY
mgnify:CR=1 FL=1